MPSPRTFQESVGGLSETIAKERCSGSEERRDTPSCADRACAAAFVRGRRLLRASSANGLASSASACRRASPSGWWASDSVPWPWRPVSETGHVLPARILLPADLRFFSRSTVDSTQWTAHLVVAVPRVVSGQHAMHQRRRHESELLMI